jgi:hypothetical protein
LTITVNAPNGAVVNFLTAQRRTPSSPSSRRTSAARQLAELGIAGGYNLYEGGGCGSKDPQVLMNTLAIYGALRGSRALGSDIDESVVKHIAQLLTSNNVHDLDHGIKLISRNKTLFNAIQNADAAIGTVGTRVRCLG